MTFNFNTGISSIYNSGDIGVLLNIPKEYLPKLDELNKLLESDKQKTVEIKLYREKRSLTANSYMFALLGQIANKMNMPLGDCYVKMLKDYGVFIQGAYLTKEAFEVFERTYNKVATTLDHNSSMCIVTREFSKGSVDWVEYVVVIGSSEYDSTQFSKLVNGVVEEAKELKIETIDELEINTLINTMFMI